MLYQQTDLVYSVIQSKISNISYSAEKIEYLLKTMGNYQNNKNYFLEIYYETVNL